jgi:SAM-dependent methyltransferase
MYELISGCRSCGSSDLEPILSFGEMPLADRLVEPGAPTESDPRYPLDVVFCGGCALVQLRQTVSPEVLFDETYVYLSSFSDELLRHSRAHAERLVSAQRLGADSLVLELASNDGYMLRNFVEWGVPVLGFEPAPAPADAAEAAGITTRREFFGKDVATRLRADGVAADVVLANNVLAHVPDLNGVVAGIATVLNDAGIATIEAPYVRDLIDRCEFDTIYHEHLCYFSVSAVEPLFRRHGLSLNHVEHLPIHGGSLRYYVGRVADVHDSVRGFLQEEQRLGLDSIEYYREFGARVRRTQKELLRLLQGLKADGKRIAAYGAAAKGAIMLNASRINGDLIDFVVDRNVQKQGRFMPGVHIPIHDPKALIDDAPDYTLLLAWNFKDEIMAQQEDYRRKGGRFIVPVPQPSVV